MLTLSINKIKSYLAKNTSNTIENLINAYYNYRDCNDFSDLTCPLCKNKTLVFHKTYERNLSFYINDELYNIKINIIVCKCEHCTKAHNKQKYHSLLPEFILPYAIYEASTIINAINQYLKHVKLIEILEKLRISHKLFYDWLRKIKKYILSSSIVLSCINDLTTVVSEIVRLNSTFLNNFYKNYYHPYFLFKLTGVPLCIIP